MKKKILTIICVLLVSNVAFADVDDVIINSAFDVEENYFKTPKEYSGINADAQKDIDDIYYTLEDSEQEDKPIGIDEMPLFKRTRLFLTGKIKRKESTDTVSSTSVKKHNFKFWKKNSETDVIPSENSEVSSSIQDATNSMEEESSPFQTGINEVVSEKEVQLDSDNLTYDDETSDVVATGHAQLYFPQQDVKMYADKIVYNQESNILKGIGHVYVIKSGVPIKSDYLELDMNEETAISNNLSLITPQMVMDSEKAVQTDGLIELTNGTFHSDVSSIQRLSSRMVGPRFNDMIIAPGAESLFLTDPNGKKLNIDVDTITVEARKYHDVIKAKKIRISHGDKKVFKWPSLTVYTNKNRDYFEGNYPEFGSRSKLGMYAGPGFAFGGPFGSVMKVIPFVNYKSPKLGVGGALKYRNPFNYTELGYGTANSIFFLRGKQRLDDNLSLIYGANSYSQEWFLGGRMPKYNVELVYDKSYKKKDFLAEGLPLEFRQRASFGLMEDNNKNYNGEHIKSSGVTTTRLRYMGEIKQSLYTYSKPKDSFYFDVSAVMQGSAALYGTGDTQFLARVGPRVSLQYKNWLQEASYYLSGYQDQTPMPRYDMYRYGHSSIRLVEVYRINKYLSVGWSGDITLTDDAPNGRLFQENRFAVAVGPDDLKFRFGYDFTRQSTYFGIDVAFDTKGTVIKYNKMTIKNPERLGKKFNDDEDNSLAFSPSAKTEDTSEHKTGLFTKKNETNKAKPLQYAQVIDIEDPNKESIQ